MKFATFATVALLLCASPAWAEGDDTASSAAATESAQVASSEPSMFDRWWNGQEAIYDSGFNLSFSFLSAHYNGDKFATTSTKEDFKSAKATGVSGFRGDIYSMGRYFGFLVLGGAFYKAGDGAAILLDGKAAPVDLTGFDVRLLHPRLRFAMWRFEAAASLGPTLHLGWAELEESRLPDLPGVDDKLKKAANSSVFANLALEASVGLRIYPISLIFVEGAYSHSFALANFVGEIDGMNGFRFGAGLAF